MRSAYTKHERVYCVPEGPSLTKQAFAKECNINNIMKGYEKNGLLEHLNTHQGDYGSFINYEDYHNSMNKILAAKDAFYTIPSAIRAKFQNDPSLFMSFAQDEKNIDLMVEMGLARAKPAPADVPDPKEGDPPRVPPIPLEDAIAASKGDTTPAPAPPTKGVEQSSH